MIKPSPQAENIIIDSPAPRDTITDGRITIGRSDALKMRAELVAQRRAALNVELNAKRMVEHSTRLIEILELIIEPSEP